MALVSLTMIVFVLSAQRHEDELTETRDTLTLELALLSEQKMAKMIQLLEELRRDSPDLANRPDREAEIMARPSDPHWHPTRSRKRGQPHTSALQFHPAAEARRNLLKDHI